MKTSQASGRRGRTRVALPSFGASCAASQPDASLADISAPVRGGTIDRFPGRRLGYGVAGFVKVFGCRPMKVVPRTGPASKNLHRRRHSGRIIPILLDQDFPLSLKDPKNLSFFPATTSRYALG